MRKPTRQTRAGQALDEYLRLKGITREDFGIAVNRSKSYVDKTISGERGFVWRFAKRVQEFSGGLLQAEALMRMADEPPKEDGR